MDTVLYSLLSFSRKVSIISLKEIHILESKQYASYFLGIPQVLILLHIAFRVPVLLMSVK